MRVCDGLARCGFVALTLGQAACTAPVPAAPTALVVNVKSDAGEGIAGAEVFQGQTLVARTGEAGTARIEVQGREGDSFSIIVRCPPAYRSPEAPIQVRRLDVSSDNGTAPAYEVRCVKLRHFMVVAVLAENGPDLPVVYLGREVARTDASGAAHVVLEMNVHDRAELMLGTSGRESEKIHPQNPVSVFEMPDHDDLQLFALTFTRDPKKRPAPPPPAKTIKTF